jgi:two-component system, NarL family, nitrate/nitrite response regulator NarL
MSEPTTVLLIDDHVLFQEGLLSLLSGEEDFRIVGQVGNTQAGLEATHRLRPELVIFGLNPPAAHGLEVLTSIASQLPETKVVVLAIQQNDDLVVEAIRSGARGFVLKDTPFVSLVRVLRAVRNGEIGISRGMVARLADEVRRTDRQAEAKASVLGALTARELQILSQLANGSSNREIAHKFVISEHTVRVHVHNVLEKLGLKNRLQAANFARQYGLRSLPMNPRV